MSIDQIAQGLVWGLLIVTDLVKLKQELDALCERSLPVGGRQGDVTTFPDKQKAASQDF